MNARRRSGIIPTARTCYDLLVFIEKEYQCSIKFWVTVTLKPGGRVEYTLFAYGSGAVFDILPDGNAMCSSAILQSEGGNIYAPMWACLTNLETHLLQWIGTAYSPPSP